MQDFIVVVTSNRANKDGSFNIFGGQGLIRKIFKTLPEAQEYAISIVDNVLLGQIPKELKTTQKTAYIEVVGHQPYDGISSIFGKRRLTYRCSK